MDADKTALMSHAAGKAKDKASQNNILKKKIFFLFLNDKENSNIKGF